MLMVGPLVFFHELGHYLVGRFFGVGVDTFSIGFGPTIAGFKGKGTYYKIGILPLGGFVKFKGSYPGEETEESVEGKGLLEAGKWQRMCIAFAGPAANILMAIAIYFVLLQVGIERPAPIVGHVRSGSVAEQAGFEQGDQIIGVDGKKVFAWDDFGKYVKENPGKNLAFKVERLDLATSSQQELTLNVVPKEKEGKDLLGRDKTIGAIGIASAFESPIVFSKQNGVASKYGIKTGDWLKSVLFLSGSKVLYEKDIEYFEHLDQALKKIKIMQPKSTKDVWVELTYLPIDLKEIKNLNRKQVDGSGLSSNQKIDLLYPSNSQQTVRLPLSDLMGEGLHFDGKNLLGLDSSRLVVRDAKENLKEQLIYGDRIVAWQGHPVDSIYTLYEFLGDQNKQDIEIEILRNGERKSLGIKLKEQEVQGVGGREKIYTLNNLDFMSIRDSSPPIYEKYSNPLVALFESAKKVSEFTGFIANVTFMFIRGELPAGSMGGPIMMGALAKQAADSGWEPFVLIMALLSINLAVVNMIPLPVLDGGQIAILGIEMIQGKPISERILIAMQKISAITLLMLIMLAFYNDIGRYWKNILVGLGIE